MIAGADSQSDGKGLPTLVRLCLIYASLFLVSGVSLPYAGTFLRDRGMSGGAIGLILAVPLLLKPFTGPALAVWADGAAPAPGSPCGSAQEGGRGACRR